MEGLRARKGSSLVPTRFAWPAKDGVTTVFVVGNFDRFLRHPLKKQPNGEFSTVIHIPVGNYLFKYVVDGEYRVRRDAVQSSILVDSEGLKYHKLAVVKPPTPAVDENASPRQEDTGNNLPESKSMSANRFGIEKNVTEKKERKSFLKRASDMFNRRSANAVTPTNAASGDKTAKNNGGQPAATTNKENSGGNGNGSYRASWRRSLKPNRGSLVSAPLSVDAVDAEEVDSKIAQWREYAKTLVQWGDHEGAGVLYEQAINLLEESDARNTYLYADLHVDMAHTTSQREDFSKAEIHIKKALGVYSVIGFDRRERHGDLLSYLAVMVDRQKRRSDAELYYYEALRVYRLHNVQGENVSITVKNLKLNLRKQGKDADVELHTIAPPLQEVATGQ